MKYDFTSVIDRTGKDSSAWENIPVPNAEIAEGFDRIPMWVADMNFQTAPSVCEAITKRLEHQVFGYFNSVRGLLQQHHQLAEGPQRR